MELAGRQADVKVGTERAGELVGEEPAELSIDEVDVWRQQLKTLVLRFREGLSEC